MRSLAERAEQEEQMDSAELGALDYAAILKDLGSANRLTMASRPTLEFIRSSLGDARSFRLLDVGFGDGGMLRSIARWASRQSLSVELVGVDLNPKSVPVARSATDPSDPIEYRTGDYRDPALGKFDFVISSLVTHHMSFAQLDDFLKFMESEARLGWFINDLHRKRLAYWGFPILARLMGWHRIVREDGQLSIARSFRSEEWTSLLQTAGIDPAEAQITPKFPFRLCVARRR